MTTYCQTIGHAHTWRSDGKCEICDELILDWARDYLSEMTQDMCKQAEARIKQIAVLTKERDHYKEELLEDNRKFTQLLGEREELLRENRQLKHDLEALDG